MGWIYIFGSASVAVPWIIVRFFFGHVDPLAQTLLAGVAIVGSAFLLSWSTEVAEMDLPRSLALAVLALVAVLPEYAVDMYFAWQAGKNPEYAHYAIANMTGGNRLLIGAAWPLVVFLYYFKKREKHISLIPSQSLDVTFLLLATAYAFTLPFKKYLSLFDSVVFIALYAAYIYFAMKVEKVEPEIEGPAEVLAKLPTAVRRGATALIFLYACFCIFISAEPFSEGLLHVGERFHIDKFLLVQWLAPLASESPEVIVASIFVLKGNASSGMGTLVSSKINQWTLLVGMLPIAYSLSAGKAGALHFDARQVEEVFITAAQSAFAIVVFSNLRLSIYEAAGLFALFIAQFLIPVPAVRMMFAYGYLVLAALMLIFAKGKARELAVLIRGSFRKDQG